MNAAVEATEWVRSAAHELVRDREQITGSRMLAYADIARLIGASKSWLSKFVTGQAEAKCPRWEVGINITAQYNALCERIESDAARRRQHAIALQEKLNAAVPRNHPMDQLVASGTSRAQSKKR